MPDTAEDNRDLFEEAGCEHLPGWQPLDPGDLDDDWDSYLGDDYDRQEQSIMSYREADKDATIEDLRKQNESLLAQVEELKKSTNPRVFSVGATVTKTALGDGSKRSVQFRFANGILINVEAADEEQFQTLDKPCVGDKYRFIIQR